MEGCQCRAAAAIALNRMYVGAHFPLDILGGVAVGLVSGGLVLVVAQRQSRRMHPTNAAPIARGSRQGVRSAFAYRVPSAFITTIFATLGRERWLPWKVP